MLEKEIKILCNAKRHYELKKRMEDFSHFHDTYDYVQVNYYYDTSDFLLAKQNNTLRVRQKEGNLKLQYKYNKLLACDITVSEEYEKEIEKLPNVLPKSILPPFDDNEKLKYHLVGALVTHRKNYHYKSAIISFDTNYYLGICDYEVEIEFENYSDAKEILSLLNIDINNGYIFSKYSRFVKLLTLWDKYHDK